MSLSKLLEEMTVLTKAEQTLPDDPDGDQDDSDIQTAAAAANGDNASEETGAGDTTADSEDEEEDADDEEVVKSFSFELEGGQKVEAFDATELIKSLGADIETLRGESVAVMTQALELIKSQSVEVASLKKQMHALGSTGRGRKAVISVAAKVSATDAMQKSETSDGLSKAEFFAKAQTAQAAGRIGAGDISLAESYLNKGLPIPQRIVSRVLGS